MTILAACAPSHLGTIIQDVQRSLTMQLGNDSSSSCQLLFTLAEMIETLGADLKSGLPSLQSTASDSDLKVERLGASEIG